MVNSGTFSINCIIKAYIFVAVKSILSLFMFLTAFTLFVKLVVLLLLMTNIAMHEHISNKKITDSSTLNFFRDRGMCLKFKSLLISITDL